MPSSKRTVRFATHSGAIMTPKRIAIHFLLLVVAFAATMQSAGAQAGSSETKGIQTIGESGITRTVASLTQAQAEHDTHAEWLRNPRHGAMAASTPDESKLGGVAAANVAIGLQFNAIRSQVDTTLFRPNASMDVGSTQVLVIADGRLRSFDKQTGVADGVLNVNPGVLFASVLPSVTAEVYDQHVRFDRATQRWIIMATEVPRQSGSNYIPNRIMIAVSSGAILSSTTPFTFFWFQPASSSFADLASLGVDANALYIGTNRFSTATGTFVGTDLHVIRKTSILSSGPLVVTSFSNFASASLISPVGVDNADTAPTHGYVIALNASGGVTALWRVNDPGGTPSLSSQLAIAGATTTANPVDVAQLGTTIALQVGRKDHRLASTRNGRLWTTHHVGVNAAGAASVGGGTRTAIRWYEIADLSTTPNVRQSGMIFDSAASNPRHHFMPSLATSGQGHTFFGFNTAGASEYVNAATSMRLRDDPLDTTRSTTAFSASQHTWARSAWGTRSRTVIDPDDDMTAWTVQQYVSGGNEWSLRVAKLLAPRPPSFLPTPTVVASGSTTNIALNATSTANGEGFFDPGVGFAKRLQVTMNGFTVNSVQFVSPTQIVVNATANAGTTAVTGAIVTNPDGQTSPYGTAARTLTVVAENGLGTVTNVAIATGAPCSGVCVSQVPTGTVFELQATPSSNAAFIGWTSSAPGFCAGISTSCTFTLNDNATVYATFAPPAAYAYQSFNIDASINFPPCRATVDAAMIGRFMRGIGGAAISGVGIPSDAGNNAAAIALQLAYRKPYFDVDGNGVIDAATDGLLILRYLAGFRGSALTANALGAPPRRADAQIENYLLERTTGFPNACVTQ
jgi:hypothetical protein